MEKMGVAVEEVENRIAFVLRPLVTLREIDLVLSILVELAGMDAVRFPDGDYFPYAGIQQREAKRKEQHQCRANHCLGKHAIPPPFVVGRFRFENFVWRSYNNIT